jgi:hypothetical protein
VGANIGSVNHGTGLFSEARKWWKLAAVAFGLFMIMLSIIAAVVLALLVRPHERHVALGTKPAAEIV